MWLRRAYDKILTCDVINQTEKGMFSPIIAIHGPAELRSVVEEGLKLTCPREISDNFGESSVKNLQLKPKYEWDGALKSTDAAGHGPNVILYMFQCAGKQSYANEEKKRLLDFFNKYNHREMPVIPIYVYDPRIKAKGLFAGSGALFSQMQADISSIQMINIKSNGAVKKADLTKIWPQITSELITSMNARIQSLKKMIENDAKLSLESTRHIVKLVETYDSISCYSRCYSLTKRWREMVRKDNSMFKSFLSATSLNYSMGMRRALSDSEKSCLYQSEPAEYDVTYLFIKMGIEALVYENKTLPSVKTAYRWICEVEPKVKQCVPPVRYYFWLTNMLLDLMTVCEHDKELGKHDILHLYDSILNWYIKILPITRKHYLTIDTNEDIDDPLKEEKAKSPAEAELYPEVYRIVSVKTRYDDELKKQLRTKFEVCREMKHKRGTSMAGISLLDLGDESEILLKPGWSKSFISDKAAHILGRKVFEDVDRFDFVARARHYFYLLNDRKATFHEEVCTKINSLMMKPEFQDVKSRVAAPIWVKITENDKIVEGETCTMTAKFKCFFKGEINCAKLRVGFFSKRTPHSSEFSVENFVLKDGALAEITGQFPATSHYIPRYIRIGRENGFVDIMLPSNNEFISVSPRPLPISLSVDMPRFMLPGCWQIALVKIRAIRPLANIKLEISGIAHRMAPLRGTVKIYPDATGLFLDVQEGEYDLYLPIKPHLSDSLRIEATAEGQTTVHEARYTVSDFLKLHAVYRHDTKIAQLSGSVTSHTKIILNEVKFFGADNEVIQSETIGLPMSLELTKSSVLSILASEPESATIYLQQDGLEPFSLRINVDRVVLDEEAQKRQSIAPLTVIVPIECTM